MQNQHPHCITPHQECVTRSDTHSQNESLGGAMRMGPLLGVTPQSQGDDGTGSLGCSRVCFAPQPQFVSSSGAEVCAIHCWDSQESACCFLHLFCIYTMHGLPGKEPLDFKITYNEGWTSNSFLMSRWKMFGYGSFVWNLYLKLLVKKHWYSIF